MAPASSPPQRLPLDLVTGFLGSGKTTLINAVLRDPGFAGAMVIVNEFGQVGLDHLLVSSAQDQVVLLDSGCLCCAVSGTLRDTLIDLFAKRAAGRVPAFDRIIVETSGLANPGPLVASLLGDSALTPRCALSQVLTLVDAALGQDTLNRFDEARRQVAFADRLVISKTDTAPNAGTEALCSQLSHDNPCLPIARWRQGEPSRPLFEALAGGTLQRTAPQSSRAVAGLRGPLRPQYGGEDNTHGGAFQRIQTHVLALQEAVDWATYARWTAALSRHFGQRLLRCKGVVRITPDGAPEAASESTPWVVQGVQGYFAPPQRLLTATTNATPTAPAGFLVCIGEAILRADLANALDGHADLLFQNDPIPFTRSSHHA